MNNIPKKSLQKVINLVGGQSSLAKLCGVRPQTVFCWLNRFGRLPAERVIQVENLVAGKVSRYELRPDIYPRND